MPDTTPPRPGRPGSPSVAEIAALTARLRRLSDAGPRADDAEREAFLADKNAMLDRIAAAERLPGAHAVPATAGHGVDEQGRPPLGPARLDVPAAGAGWNGPHLTAERVARAERAMAEALARHGVDLTGDADDIEQSRRDQLTQWATDQAGSAVEDDSRVRGDEPTPHAKEESP